MNNCTVCEVDRIDVPTCDYISRLLWKRVKHILNVHLITSRDMVQIFVRSVVIYVKNALLQMIICTECHEVVNLNDGKSTC